MNKVKSGRLLPAKRGGDNEAPVGRSCGAVWATMVVIPALKETPLATRDPTAFMLAAGERVKSAGVGNCALALIKDGDVFDSYFYSVGAPVDGRTLFQMASVSKWVTSWGIMPLV